MSEQLSAVRTFCSVAVVSCQNISGVSQQWLNVGAVVTGQNVFWFSEMAQLITDQGQKLEVVRKNERQMAGNRR